MDGFSRRCFKEPEAVGIAPVVTVVARVSVAGVSKSLRRRQAMQTVEAIKVSVAGVSKSLRRKAPAAVVYWAARFSRRCFKEPEAERAQARGRHHRPFQSPVFQRA